MKRWEAEYFWDHWERELTWEQDSCVAGLFSSRDLWEGLPAAFRESLMWRYQILPLEIAGRPHGGIRYEKKVRERKQQLKQWKPADWAVVGDFAFQQWAAVFAEEVSQPMGACVHILTGSDFQVAGSEDVWLRDREGRTHCRKRMEREQDVWVMLHKRDPLEQKVFAWRKKLFGECGRDLLEELAEPLLILYGVPIEIGGYFALRYLFCAWGKETAKPDRWEKAYRDLVRLGQRYRRAEIEGLMIPEKNLPLLTRMAADGIMGLPERQRPGKEMIEGFYRTLSC